jgi:hypothetical protein
MKCFSFVLFVLGEERRVDGFRPRFFLFASKDSRKEVAELLSGEILLGDDLVFELAFIEYRLLYSEPEGGVCRSKRSGSLDWT